MNTTIKQNDLQIIFVSHEQKSDSDFLINLLARHPEICVFEGTDALIDSLLLFPHNSFSIHNSIFFELIFDLFNDSRFSFSEFTLKEFDEVGKSKNCFGAFQKLMKLYCNNSKPGATILVYRFPSPLNFKNLFNNYIIKDLHAKYINLLPPTSKKEVNEITIAGYYGILQIKQNDFINNYIKEYKRLFSFINSPAMLSNAKPVNESRKLYKKSAKLKEVPNSWYKQIVSAEKNKPEEVLIERIF